MAQNWQIKWQQIEDEFYHENRYFSINYKKKNKKKKNEKMKRQATHPSNHENVIIINRNSSVDYRIFT